MKMFGFDTTDFRNCCQAFIVSGFHYLGKSTSSEYAKQNYLLSLGSGSDYMRFAITADHQDDAIGDALKEAGFEAIHTYRATTGSYLTAWMYKPKDYERQIEDFEDDDDDF